ncbi:MAG: FRG domain-containing protein [Bacteroidetes bacterium]|nr:FRG domain-containing protein [Bacteroidota bacterium]
MIDEIRLENAKSLWVQLGECQEQSNLDEEMIYRGHSNARWPLLPAILRPQTISRLENSVGHLLKSDQQVWTEFVMLRNFIYNCDKAGTSIPNDSVKFRENFLTDESFSKYLPDLSIWPHEELFECLALAQLHGLPTRLLDWTTSPYTAIYFAVSQALSQSKWEEEQELSVFAFNKGHHLNTYRGPIKILKVGGSVSKNVVAQQGLFTIHPVEGHEEETIVIKNLEEYLPSDQSILKFTVPIQECIELYEMCNQFGFNAPRLFPTADGASLGVIEYQSFVIAKQKRLRMKNETSD